MLDGGALILQLAGMAAFDDIGDLVAEPRHEHSCAVEPVGGVLASVTEELVSCLNHLLPERMQNK